MNEDERIASTLNALTHAEAPQGMEQRVLRRLQQPRPTPARRWWIPASAACVCALVALSVRMQHRVPTPSPIAPQMATATPPPPAPSATIRTTLPATHPRPRKVNPVHAVEASYPAPIAPLTEQEKLLVKLAHAREEAMSKPPTAMSAPPSTTAKAEPLTGQERLLIAVSRVRQDAVLDALSPDRKARAEAAEEQEFKTFVASMHHGGS